MNSTHKNETVTNCGCVNRAAVVENCCVCGKPVMTCERGNAVNGSYLCPEHLDGVELTDGRWVCSIKCWDTVVK